jgi:hypothetical protein
MKKLLLIFMIVCLVIQCSDDNDRLTNLDDFSFGLNEKQSFDNEISLRINSNFEQIDFISSQINNLPIVINSIEYKGQIGTTYIVTTNSTKDTLIAYTREDSNGIIQDGLRYIIKNENQHIFETITINQNNKSIEVIDRIELDVNTSSGRGTLNHFNKNDEPKDLEEQTDETLEFFSDPTETHPIVGFFNGIVDGIVDGSTELYENAADKLNSIKESLSNANQILINKLKNAKVKLEQASEYIQEQTAETLESITQSLEESETTDFEIEDFTDYENVDDNFPDEPGDLDQNLLIDTWLEVGVTENGVDIFSSPCDYTLQFTQTQLFSTEFWGENCENAETYVSNYSINGNIITESADGETSIMTVLQLTSSTLKLRELDGDFEYIYTYSNNF